MPILLKKNIGNCWWMASQFGFWPHHWGENFNFSFSVLSDMTLTTQLKMLAELLQKLLVIYIKDGRVLLHNLY